MSQITINTISGVAPYTIYVCDVPQITCTFVTSGVTSVPLTFTLPENFLGYITVAVKVVDANNCEFVSLISCLTQTPTPSITSTPTVTNSQTPSNTVTPSITQTSVTPTPTPSFTQSPTVTPTFSPTPSVTSESQFKYNNCAICFTEQSSESIQIGTYMNNKGLNFLGFTNGTNLSSSQATFEVEMNAYMDYFISTNTGLTISLVPTTKNGPISGPIIQDDAYLGDLLNSGYSSSVLTLLIDQQSDDYGNINRLYNFQTVQITGYTTGWYTWIIPTGLTLGLYQKNINLGIEDQNTFQNYEMNSDIYSNYFTYTGTNFVNSVYRVYTTYPSLDFYLDNSISVIYFKGNSLGG
jgi:hypothetical protein